MRSELLIIFTLSVCLAAWTYSRAFKMHNLIEQVHPGFNEQMRRARSFLRRMGLKHDGPEKADL